MHCRSSSSSNAEWWPGGIQSPAVYYHLRSRQLRYAQGNPHHSGPSWRSATEVHTGPSELLQRRKQGNLAVLVPQSYTNVAAGDERAFYLGERVVRLAKPPPVAQQTPSSSCQVQYGVPKRGIETPLRSARLTWSHPSEYDATFPLSDSDNSSTRSSMENLDFKRRCTETAPVPVLPGHIIARRSPVPQQHHHHHHQQYPQNNYHQTTPIIYPSMVVSQHHHHSSGLCHPSSTSSSSSSLFGVVTPPIAPLSATSDVYMSSSSSSNSIFAPTSASSDLADPSLPFQQPSQQFQPLPPFQHPSTALLNVLMANGNAPGGDDPTMQQYYARQYNIKQEQAFPCHQVMEIDSSLPLHNNNTTATANMDIHQHHDNTAAGDSGGGWASMFLSLAGSFKRSISP